jgi:hypothetical protein
MGTLDERTERRLVRKVWVWAVSLLLLLVAFTAVLMAVRQMPSITLQLGELRLSWRFDSTEFGSIGQWVSGIAAALALWSTAALVVNDRHRERVRLRRADAYKVHYNYSDEPEPTWVVRNGSTNMVTLLEVDGHPVSRGYVLQPGDSYTVKKATLLARSGYREDQPQDDLVFHDEEYRWTRTGSLLSGVQLNA